MPDAPPLTLQQTFIYKNKYGTYKLCFYQDFLTITDTKNEQFKETHKYMDIHKVKTGSTSLKIKFQDGNVMKVPCTMAEVKGIQKIFKKCNTPLSKKCTAALIVEFGERCFFVQLSSTDYIEFRTAVIKRIARFFFPSHGHEDISLETFSSFMFNVKHRNQLILIENTEDLEAAILFCKRRLHIIITKIEE